MNWIKTLTSSFRDGADQMADSPKVTFQKSVEQIKFYAARLDSAETLSQIKPTELLGYLGMECDFAAENGVTLNDDERLEVKALAETLIGKFPEGKVVYGENRRALSRLNVSVNDLERLYPQQFTIPALVPGGPAPL